MVKNIFILAILFAHENLAFSMRDFLWRVRREILAVVILQQGFTTRLSAKKCVYWMLNFYVWRVYSTRSGATTQHNEYRCTLHLTIVLTAISPPPAQPGIH